MSGYAVDEKALLLKAQNIIKSMEGFDDAAVMDAIENVVLDGAASGHISPMAQSQLIETIFNRMRRYDVLQPLLEDDSITEIMINGPSNIFVEVDGRLMPSGVAFESNERLETVIQQIVSEVDRTVNRSRPIADARLKDGSRVNVVLPPVALDGAVVTIRKFFKGRLSLNMLVERGTLTEEISDFLARAVRSRYNILICGGTGSGKTTFLNALSENIPSDERVVTIEDSAELQLKGIPNLIRLEARSGRKNDDLQVSMRDLIKSSLRMRPDRVIMGEVRGEEALDMLQAMNTGHDGSITTGHSNSGKDMLHRLETMIMSSSLDIPIHSIRRQIASGLDLIVYLRRFKDGRRRVVSIDEITEYDGSRISTERLYEYDSKAGYKKCSNLQNGSKMQTHTGR